MSGVWCGAAGVLVCCNFRTQCSNVGIFCGDDAYAVIPQNRWVSKLIDFSHDNVCGGVHRSQWNERAPRGNAQNLLLDGAVRKRMHIIIIQCDL